jgi:Lon protease-like protein
MTGRSFGPEFHQLPLEIPIFPLPSALLLPAGQLPLNIFEPRYIAMINHALATPTRLIGMVQPAEKPVAGNPVPDLFRVGCAGRIAFFQESDDGRYVIALKGVSRFKINNASLHDSGFRTATVDWNEFANDLRIDLSTFDRRPLMEVLRRYFDLKGFDTDWTQIEKSDNQQLLATLSMVCPFETVEKQALLEAESMVNRADLLIAMMEMALHEETGDHDARH